ncbi:anhydro-N-acetylmuramic acid kinase [Verticiella sediminum]|uniref:anhydro-N-acetylmuramic acid kinase n=1 Tax=Verticiella sediminum TaxID=1247510 RepID=UPI0031F0CB79
MSGTSLDGADGVLAVFDEAGGLPRVQAAASAPFAPALRAELLALNRPGDNELHRAAMAANQLVDVYADVVGRLLGAAGLGAHEVRAIGAHGQTVRHQPALGYTLQLNAPARLAEATGIAVVADLRSRDVAAGGHGAPLAPAFHHAVFAGPTPRVVLNLGGIANVSLLEGGGVLGLDTGPANVLMDLWAARHTDQPYDRDGALAARGTVDGELLELLVASEPWLALPPPKSTGRDLFHAEWLDDRLARHRSATGRAPEAADVQATLAAYTARTVADAIRRHAPGITECYVCGGGAANPVLLAAIAAELPGVVVASTAELGIPPQQVEALAFAWLARTHVEGLSGNLPAVTGARGPRILGAYYPA